MNPLYIIFFKPIITFKFRMVRLFAFLLSKQSNELQFRFIIYFLTLFMGHCFFLVSGACA